MSLINLKSQTDLSGFYVVYNGSTALETPGVLGISHLMEHLVCKGFDHLQDEFSENGIYWNAYTSNDRVVFYMTGLDEYLAPYKEKMLLGLTEFNLTEEAIENEKKIVIEEYLGYFNDQSYAHSLNLNRRLYNYYDPLGLKSDLEKVDLKTCQDWFKKQFLKPSKIINVSKHSELNSSNFDFNNIPELIEVKIEANPKAPIEKLGDFDEKISLIVHSKLFDTNRAEMQIASAMLVNGLNSPLVYEIREKRGLVYDISGSVDYMGSKGVLSFTTSTSYKNEEIIKETLNNVLSNPVKYLTRERFNIIKKEKTINYKKAKINLHNNVSSYITPDMWVLSNKLEAIEYEQVIEAYTKNMKDYSISIDKELYV
jgi:predicted Zn-dependent peptidase